MDKEESWNKSRGQRTIVKRSPHRESWSNQQTFLSIMAKFLVVAAEILSLFELATCVCPIFLFLYWMELVLHLVCPCFTSVHCVCCGGKGKILSFIWLVTRTLEAFWTPWSRLCVSCRDLGLGNTCSKWMRLCVFSFWRRMAGGGI